MAAPDDRPLTVAELNGLGDPMRLLAQRVAAHLGEGWEVGERGTRDAMLRSPEGVKIAFVLNTHRVALCAISEGNLRQREVESTNVFALPSQVAHQIATHILPAARKRQEAARKSREYQRQRSGERKAHITAIAQLLDWNATSTKCHSHPVYSSIPLTRTTRSKGRYRKPVEGAIGATDDGTFYLRMEHLTPEMVTAMVRALHYQLNRKGATDA